MQTTNKSKIHFTTKQLKLTLDLEKLCKNDIRFMYLLDEMKAPSHATFGNFIRNELTTTIEQIFKNINAYIFEIEHVDINHTYMDGTKIEANANRYTWVMNSQVLGLLGIKLEKREEYSIEYVEELLCNYAKTTSIDETTFVSGIGHRKSIEQRQYACIESFHSILKKEEIHHNKYSDFKMAGKAIFEYIESWYNRKRIHGSLNHMTPQAFEDAVKACSI